MGENINWVNLKAQISQKKQSQWKQAKQTKEWYYYPSYMNIETWKTPSDHLLWGRIFRVAVYASMSEGWSHKGNKECACVHHADQLFSSLRWLKTLSLFWNSKDFYKATYFCFWYQTETFKHYEKWNSWGQEKCLAPPLNLNSPVGFFSSSPISNLIPKSLKPLLMGLGYGTIVVTREWLQCSKLKIKDKCSFVNWIGLLMTESKCNGWQFFSEFLNLKTSKTCSGPNLYRKCIWLLDLPLWNINKDLFCCRTFGLKVWTWVGEISNVLFFKSDFFS